MAKPKLAHQLAMSPFPISPPPPPPSSPGLQTLLFLLCRHHRVKSMADLWSRHSGGSVVSCGHAHGPWARGCAATARPRCEPLVARVAGAMATPYPPLLSGVRGLPPQSLAPRCCASLRGIVPRSRVAWGVGLLGAGCRPPTWGVDLQSPVWAVGFYYPLATPSGGGLGAVLTGGFCCIVVAFGSWEEIE